MNRTNILIHYSMYTSNILILYSMNRSNLAEMEDLFYDLSSFAVDDPALEGMGLVDTIKLVKPNILIGEFLIKAKTVLSLYF